jgi:hypothetical protein
MKNEYYFQIDISEEQISLANKLVDYSIVNHPVKDIFAKDPEGKVRQREFRFTGTIGEIVFADAYGLPRPTRSFGAIDGQDFGQDFVLEINGQPQSFDVKSMGRKNNNFRTNYVLNLPAYQMRRENVVTDYYFCISIHNFNTKFIASFLGYVSKNEIETNVIGILHKAGSRRIKDDGGSFSFQRDTFEVDFKDICSPLLNNHIQETRGFMRKSLLPPFQKK